MTVSKILTALFKDFVAGLTLYGVGIAMANGAVFSDPHLCDPRYCDPVQGSYNESE